MLVIHYLSGYSLRVALWQALCLVDQCQLVLLGLRPLFELLGFLGDFGFGKFARVGNREPFAKRHGAGAGGETRKTREQNDPVFPFQRPRRPIRQKLETRPSLAPSTAARKLLPDAARCRGPARVMSVVVASVFMLMCALGSSVGAIGVGTR